MKKSALVVLLCMFTATYAFAGTTGYSLIAGTGSAEKTDTRAYAGLNWTLGGGATPALVLGVFDVKVKANGDTTGGNLAFHINLTGGVKPGKVKLAYINGKEDVQGEIGLGYDFLKNAPLLGLGINAPYVSAGVDAYGGPGFVLYGTLHSQDKFNKPNRQCVWDNATAKYSDAACTIPKVL